MYSLFLYLVLLLPLYTSALICWEVGFKGGQWVTADKDELCYNDISYGRFQAAPSSWCNIPNITRDRCGELTTLGDECCCTTDYCNYPTNDPPIPGQTVPPPPDLDPRGLNCLYDSNRGQRNWTHCLPSQLCYYDDIKQVYGCLEASECMKQGIVFDTCIPHVIHHYHQDSTGPCCCPGEFCNFEDRVVITPYPLVEHGTLCWTQSGNGAGQWSECASGSVCYSAINEGKYGCLESSECDKLGTMKELCYNGTTQGEACCCAGDHCNFPLSNPCPLKWEPSRITPRKCLLYGHPAEVREDAIEKCKAAHPNATLVTITNGFENVELKSFTSDRFWIGLKRKDFIYWEWDDGSTSSYRHWGNGQPNPLAFTRTGVVLIQETGAWYTSDYDDPYDYVCQLYL